MVTGPKFYSHSFVLPEDYSICLIWSEAISCPSHSPLGSLVNKIENGHKLFKYEIINWTVNNEVFQILWISAEL